MHLSFSHKPALLRHLLLQYNNISLRRKIALSYLLIVFLLVGILAVTIYTFTASSIRKQSEFSLRQCFYQGNSFLTYKFDSIDSSGDMIMYNGTINLIMNRNAKIRPAASQNADAKTIIHLLKNLQENDDIRRARLYVPDELIYSDTGVNISSFSQAEKAPWWNSLFERKGTHLFVGNDSLEDRAESRQQYISLLRVMYRQEDYSKLAFILRLDVPLQNIEEILISSKYTSDSITLLIDREGNVVASSESDSIYLPFSEESDVAVLLKPTNDRLIEMQDNGIKYIMLKSRIKGTGFTMVTLVPQTAYNIAVTSLLQTTAGVSLVVLLLAFALSKPVSRTITKRIDTLCGYMQQTKDGTLALVPDVIYKDEIGILYENYNFMIGRIHTLINENYRIGRELKSAEYKALQSQINPHFLYNTLDMISWLSYRNQSSEISSVVHSLANFYKLSLNRGKDVVPIGDEISHVTYYINIQDLRFSGNIRFSVQIPPVLLQFSIPKITLQPIVENAVFHGILEAPSGTGSITLLGKLTGDQVLLTVSDNGLGIPSGQLASLLSSAEGDTVPEDGGSHYGLRNIDRRIKLRYGEEYGLSFESTPGKGTMVHILLPAIHVDELV